MVSTPFFGPFETTRSTNLADNALINLRPELCDTKQGKNVGALYGTPGLTLLGTAGDGPINGERKLGTTTLYVVSGTSVYTVTTGYVATLVGAVSGYGGRVSMQDNGTQMAIFTDTNGYVGPAGYPLTGGTISSSGYPLTGGVIGSGGARYAIGDVITLNNNDGTQSEAAILQVTGESGGVVNAVSIYSGGEYTVQPSGFTQASTTGSGSGFTFVSPQYGPLIEGGINYNVDDQIVLFSSTGTQTAAAILKVTAVSNGSVTAFSIIQTGAFDPVPSTAFMQQITTGSGSGFSLVSPTFGASTALCELFLPFTPAGNGMNMSATFQDGFLILTQPGTNAIWQSLVEDISIYPPLNFAFANGESDFVMAVYSIHREVFVIKTKCTEVWNDAGTAGFAFQPLPAVMIEHGTPAWGTVVKVGDSLFWLAQSSQGTGVVVEVEGFQASRRSTHAIETLIGNANTVTDAFAYSYLQDGHELYVLVFPTGNFTIVYDRTDSRLLGVPVWYQWLYFSNGLFGRHLSNAFSFFNETPVVGDYRNGNLYEVNLTALTDNGQPIRRMRSWRAVQQPSMQPRRFASLELDMQTGINVVTANPQVILDWSDDGGHNFSNQRIMAAGQVGQTAIRVRSNRLGSTRRNSGLDRIFRIQTADQIPICFIRAEIDV